MSRSVKKGPFISAKLIKKIKLLEKAKNRSPIKTWSRSSIILPLMVGYTIEVYNGRAHIPVFITEEMIGHKLGEFSPTRTFRSHVKNVKSLKT